MTGELRSSKSLKERELIRTIIIMYSISIHIVRDN